MIETRNLKVGGGILFWSLSRFTRRELLLRAWTAAGLETLVPGFRKGSANLRTAMDDAVANSRAFVRPTKNRNAFILVEETRVAADDNAYATTLKASVEGDADQGFRLHFDPWDSRANKIQVRFDEVREYLTSDQLSTALVSVLMHLGGTRLRPDGAIYWLPAARLDQWDMVVKGVEESVVGDRGAADMHKLYLLRNVMDQDAVKAIHDAITHEIETEAALIRREVLETDLGEKGLNTRVERARDLAEKLMQYEQLLDEVMPDLREITDKVKGVAATAVMRLAAGDYQAVAV